MKRLYKLILGVLVAILLFSLSACSGSSRPEAVSPTPEVIEPTPEPTPEEEQVDDDRGIPGSHITDIRMGLASFGLEEASIKSAPEEAKAVFAYSSGTSYTHPLLNVMYDYQLSADEDFELISGSIGIESQYTLSNDEFVELAQMYLGYAATVPYDTSDTTATKEWVQDNIPSAAEEACECMVGDAVFTLSGTENNGTYGAFWLDIKAK